MQRDFGQTMAHQLTNVLGQPLSQTILHQLGHAKEHHLGHAKAHQLVQSKSPKFQQRRGDSSDSSLLDHPSENRTKLSVLQHLSRMLSQPGVKLTVSQAIGAQHSTNFQKVLLLPRKGMAQPWRRGGLLRKRKSPKFHEKLVNLSNFKDKKVNFAALALDKVTLRLERTIGSLTFNLDDDIELRRMSDLILLEEEKEFRERVSKRRNVELERRRQLVVEGKVEPIIPGEEALLSHPLLRCKRVIDRVSKMASDAPTPVVGGVPVPFHRPLKPITPAEPFEAYERTGLLFGEHKNHYMRVQRPPLASIRTITESVASFHVPSYLRFRSSRRLTPRGTSLKSRFQSLKSGEAIKRSRSKIQPNRSVVPPVQQSPEESVDENEADESERDRIADDNEAVESQSSPMADQDHTEAGESLNIAMEETPGSLAPSVVPRSDTASTESPSANTSGADGSEQQCGTAALASINQRNVTLRDLEKMYQVIRPKFVDESFTDPKSSGSLLRLADGIIGMYKREQVKTDEFCRTKLRQTFDSKSRSKL